MKRFLNILTLVVLSSVILLNGTPREFLHSFAGHEDTVDYIHNDYATDHHASFEHEHHHCEFLNLLPPVYHPVEQPVVLTFLRPVHPLFLFSVPEPYRSERERSFLRGPPAC